jgi:hypothetical protein
MNKQTEKEKSDYMFKFAMNITPKPYKRDGGKRCPVVTNINGLVVGNYYWVRVWTGAGNANWALMEYVAPTADGMKFKFIAAMGDPGMENIIMLAPALNRKQIRVAGEWS